MEIIFPHSWADQVTSLVYELVLSDKARVLDESGKVVSLTLRSLASHTECVGDMSLDPIAVVGSGSFLCVRRWSGQGSVVQYDMLKWFDPDATPGVTWSRLFRSVD